MTPQDQLEFKFQAWLQHPVTGALIHHLDSLLSDDCHEKLIAYKRDHGELMQIIATIAATRKLRETIKTGTFIPNLKLNNQNT